jgi:integral membrane sensor domain MASE1
MSIAPRPQLDIFNFRQVAWWKQLVVAIAYVNGYAKDTIQFIIYGCFLSHFPVAIFCSLLLCLFGKAPWSIYFKIAISWWLGDVFGILILASLIIAWQKNITSFTKLIKRHWLEAIIILSLNVLEEDRQACFNAGMNDFMTKPIGVEELASIIKKAKI